MAKEMDNTPEVKAEVKPRGVDVRKFKARKLKAINEMTNKAKARFLAERVSQN